MHFYRHGRSDAGDRTRAGKDALGVRDTLGRGSTSCVKWVLWSDHETKYRVVFRARIPTGPRTPDFGSYIMSYSHKTTCEGIRGSQALSITLQG